VKKAKKIAILTLIFSYSLIWTICSYFELTNKYQSEWSFSGETNSEKELETLYINGTESLFAIGYHLEEEQKPIAFWNTLQLTGILLKKDDPPPERKGNNTQHLFRTKKYT
jgi:hypothetical protein